MAWLLAWSISEQRFNGPIAPLVWVCIALLTSWRSGVFKQHYRFIGFQDLLRIGISTVALIGIGILLQLIHGPHNSSLGLWIMAGVFTGCGWSLVRALFRFMEENRSILNKHTGQATLIFGAGRAGLLVAEELTRHPELGCDLVGFLDDDLSKQGVRLRGFPVLGTQEILPLIVQEHKLQTLILAIPSASGTLLRKIASQANKIGIQVKTVPGIFNFLDGSTWKPKLRDISIEDLLRREPIQLDQQRLRSIVTEKVVLVTGAGGSIGSEIARQVCGLLPSRVVLLGRGENSLWESERQLRGLFPNQQLSIELCDIRNSRRLGQAFNRWRPDIVFHAAAHKHVPFLEQHPEEAVENNILGTRNVLDASISTGVDYFVNISTDKAVNPTNVLGASKRIAEMLVAETSHRVPEGGLYVSVRFGNVLGSRGSVVPIFQRQIQNGGPITITHPEMTRYFMTIPEASQLVLQAGLLGETGKVYVLDMGNPVRILDLAKDMVQLSGLVPDQDIEIHVSGIRPGEKLFEELFYGEAHRSQVHPKVFEAEFADRIDALELSAQLQHMEELLALPDPPRRHDLIQSLCTLVPGYVPSKMGAGQWLSLQPKAGKPPIVSV